MYAGDVSPQTAHEAVAQDSDAVIIDVRTPGEWAMGLPALPDVKLVSWQFPDGTFNPSFLDQLVDAGVRHDQPVYFLCRSGARSHSAAVAVTAQGYTEAYNIAGGFEGKPPMPGWRDLLPWQVPGS